MSVYSILAGPESSYGKNVWGPTTSSGQAQGAYQITTGTWNDFAPKAGVDLSQYPTPNSAPLSVQGQVASQIPIGRWETAPAVYAAYPGVTSNMTLGQIDAQTGGNGPPSSFTQNPTYGAQGTVTGSLSYDTTGFGGSGLDSSAGPYGALTSNPTQATPTLGTPGEGSFDYFNTSPFSGTNATTANPNQDYSIAGAPDIGTQIPSATPSATQIPGATPAAGAVSAQSGGSFLSAGGKPVNITDISAAGSQAGSAVQQGLTASAGQLATAGTSWFASLESSFTDLTVRGGLILLALVILLGAWMFYSTDHGKSGPIIIPV